MKAFQLKMVINDSKPPIWRRVIVPAGITFSQLSMILNKAMGWCGYHSFEFEFYHLELRIIEDTEEFGGGYGPHDYLEASETFIREYLEKNDWFTYVYDLGDHWKHRVTVEKVLEDYEYDYPQVIKFKGNCPPEDCGGIWGYYEYLEAIEDENYPDREERLAWLEMQGYPEEYDMEWTNRVLQTEYFYKWGKGEKRSQRELYDEFFDGKKGLNATRQDKNKAGKLIQSGKHRTDEAIKRFAESFRTYVNNTRTYDNEYILDYITLKDILEDFEREQIIEIMQDKGITGPLNGNKATLIRQLVGHMLKPEVMERYFTCLSDEEIQVFEKAAMTEGYYYEEDSDELEYLIDGCYIGELESGPVRVPRDVWNAYQKMQGADFDRKRTQMSHIMRCVSASNVLYGIVPLHILRKLVNKHPELAMSVAEIKECLQNIPPEYQEFVLVGDRVYAKALYPEDKGLWEAQGDKAYYIPELEEIISLADYGFTVDGKEAEAFCRLLSTEFHKSKGDAILMTVAIQNYISMGVEPHAVIELLESFDIYLKSKRQINRLMNVLLPLWNNTRMVVHRGFTPSEMAKTENKTIKASTMTAVDAANKPKDNIIDFQTAKKSKVYPNDPCPCGSGKKYKNCCKDKK